MSNATAEPAQDVIARISALVEDRISDEQRTLVRSFIERYYAGTAAEDLVESDVPDLYGAALAHWNLARQREPDAVKMRVYNPEPQQHGWQSTHTIVELVVDDMPFIVDSVRLALSGLRLTIHLVVHPVIRIVRDAEGRMLSVVAPGEEDGDARPESVLRVAVDRQTESSALEEIEQAVRGALTNVRLAVDDWAEMRGRLRTVLDSLGAEPPPLEPPELETACAFLEWLDANHFTYLGYRCYDLAEEGGEDVLRSVAGSSLGILRESGDGGRVSRSFAGLSPELKRSARERELLIITKANTRSVVHRPGYMDHVGIKRFDANGNVVGEHRFLGLFTSAAYNRSPRDIPLLREKVAAVLERAGYAHSSHASKALLNTLETFPRDDLFQIPVEALYDTAMGILHLQERQRIRLFVHPDRFGRFCSCIVYVPRERFNTQLRQTFHDVLAEALGAEDSEFDVSLSESVLARLYFKMRLVSGMPADFDRQAVEARLRAHARAWTDDLYDALLEHCGEARGTRLFRRYGEAFRSGYRETYSARIAVHDVEKMETLDEERDLAMSLYRSVELGDDELEFKIFHQARPIPLCDILPMLENMGLKVIDERPSKIKRGGSPRIWLHDFGMRHNEPASLDVDRIRDKFQEAFERVWRGDAESDGFNRLVLRAGLDWREIVILRACCKYLRQAGIALSQAYMEGTLAGNPKITAALVALFHVRLDPARDGDREQAAGAIVEEIVAALDDVSNLDEDRILRSFLGVVRAVLRTNFYQVDGAGEHKSYLSLKLDPQMVAELPEPRPMFEIFVYSPRVEGVHLRGGPAARGGLRWSDRREDFRTEVLGLMKAQMVKNAVIVPVGSKGGFVPKQLPDGDREAFLTEGKACYRTFIRGLLDVTDNLDGAEVVPPPNVVRHDGDDPYLVVAADKGTATFSDIANAIALEYGFWLGDAFASGGSQGYDHKGMGITARGAWESVKRSFREFGVDTQSTPFTVVGVGDMSGDVFGNGMLLSEQIKLVGAFNHLHVFVDPDPDPAQSFAERSRLFALPRSTWDDYDRTLLSSGGGIYARSAKSIPLSDEVRSLLGISDEALTPNELIRAMLRAPVDLLWNGGIGTYVKADHEHHDDAGDRANDAVRIDATELRCRVVGEGGNLGVTQRGRIQAALAGVRINTDAIDNAGGVDCSDHEVNIKILLNGIVGAGEMTEKQRNRLLAEMTDEVGELVLRSNYLQTQALSLAVAQAPSMLDVHTRMMRELERTGALQREIEFLPGKEVLDERQAAGGGLVAPELSVLMAYVKIGLFQSLLESDLADDPALARELVEYFPVPIRERFREYVLGHRLAREIICTVIANEIVNRCGGTFAFRMMEETRASVADVARAYIVARESFRVEETWAEIESLDNRAGADTQIAMLLESRKLIERASRWLLRHRASPLDIGAGVRDFQQPITTLAGELAALVSPGAQAVLVEQAEHYVEGGAPEPLAQRVAGFDELYAALDIAEVAAETSLAVPAVATVYCSASAVLGFEWLRERIVALPRDNRWQTLARAALRDELYEQARIIAADILLQSPGEEPADQLQAWLAANDGPVARASQVMTDLHGAGSADFTMLSVAMREIRGMRQLRSEPAATKGKRRRAKGKAA